jgi:hypothetical protein
MITWVNSYPFKCACVYKYIACVPHYLIQQIMFVLTSLRIKHNKINKYFEVKPAFFFINAIRLIVWKDPLCFLLFYLDHIFYLQNLSSEMLHKFVDLHYTLIIFMTLKH